MVATRVRSLPGSLLAVVVVAFVLRVLIVALTDSPICCDADDYVRHGRSIAAGDGYPESMLVKDGGATVLRPPLYPFALGAVFAMPGDDLASAQVAQAASGALVAGLLGLLAWQVFGSRRHAVVAAALAAVYPAFILEANTFLSEALFLPLEIAAVCAAWQARIASTRRGAWVAVTGGLIGLAMLTRQTGALLLVPGLAALVTAPGRSRAHRLQHAAVLVLVALATVLPWTARNYVVTDELVLTGRQTGLQLSGVYNDEARLDPKNPALWIPPSITARDADLFTTSGLDEIELDRELRARSLDYAAEHPTYVVEAILRNTVRMLAADGEAAAAGSLSMSLTEGQGQVARIGWWVAAALAITGWFTASRRRVPIWMWLVPLMFFAAGATSAGLLRYRIPADPFVLLLAALAVVAGLDRARRSA